jgi:Tfp pilus assembly protein PilZ
LRGTVVDLRTGEDATQPEIEVEVDPLHEERLRYVAAVLDRERPATARRFRRVPATLGARWSTVAEEAASANAEHLLDLSRGGAFVVSTHAPAIGAELDLELDLGAMRRPLHVKGVVAWTGTNQGQGGFGVRFLVRDSELADRLAALVDELDDAPSIR